MSALPWLGLDENVILRAGAGTGKTHALVSMAMGLLAGLRRGQRLEAHQLWLLTFGEQAAGELRVRLRERITALADGGSPEVLEPDLVAAAQALNARLPSRDGWRALLEQVGAVNATTLHGAGAALLREHGGPALGGFEVLDAEAADKLLSTAAQEAILNVGLGGQAEALLADLGYRGSRFQPGVVESLREIRKKLAEDGSELPPDPPTVLPDLEEWGQRVRPALAEAGVKHTLPEALRLERLLDAAQGQVTPGLLDSIWGDIDAANEALGLKRKHRAKEASDALDEVSALLGRGRAIGHSESFRALLGDVEARYRAAKRRRNALDFSDLCNLSRDLLRDNLAARRAAKARVGALLLDETQDTSRVQYELCLLLCEARSTEARVDPLARLGEQLRLERGVLCAVGDRKQSIYEFRGANVAVFEELAAVVTRDAGRTELLNISRRSHAALVGFVNRFFERAMLDGGPGAPGFSPDDTLVEKRAASGLPPAVLLALEPIPKENADAARHREARAVAHRAAGLLRNPPAELRAAMGRDLLPGDVALLFRASTHMDLFRAALAEAGLPSVLIGGDGFWDRSEVLDAVALMAAAVDPGDGLAALTLLRSPLCGITDASLGRLAFANPGKLSLRWLREALPASLPDEDRAKLVELDERLRDMRRAGLGGADFLRAAELQLGLRARYADAQASANLDKLEAKVAVWQSAGESLVACTRRLVLLARERLREPLELAVDGGEKAAVRLLTVHASKGLEFPVVFVATCGTRSRLDTSPALYARDLGLGLKARSPSGKWVQSVAYELVDEEIKRRGEAEELRLLYVAATRARDLLFFSGELPVNVRKGPWRAVLDAHGPAAGLEVETVAGDTPLGTGPLFGAPVEALAAGPLVEQALAETAPLPLLIPKVLPLAASAAGDLWLCQRRFQLRQLWQNDERAANSPGQPSFPDAEDLPLEQDPRALGSLAHRLLEVIDLEVAGRDLEGALRSAAAQVSPQGVDAELLSEVRSVLSSPLGQRMLSLPPSRVLREVPFVLRLGSKPVLAATGSIDLLLVLDDRVLVLDYKRGPPRETASYEAQVRLYALAAQELTGGALPVHAGLWFLRGGSVDPRTSEVRPDELTSLRRELADVAREVAGRDARRSLFPGRELSHCRKIDCGFVGRCHSAPAT